MHSPQRPAPPRRALGANTLTAIASAAFATVYSLAFWRLLVASDLPPGLAGTGFLVAAFLVLFALNGLFLSLLAWRGVQKPALALLLVVAAALAYFMDGFGAVVDRHAVQSVLETDLREGSEWLSWQMAAYLLGLGVLPAVLLLRLPVHYRPWPRELLARGGFVLLLVVLMGASVAPFARDFAATARNHGELRHLASPLNLLNALRGYVKHSGPAEPLVVAPLGADARQAGPAEAEPLLVLVVGESARASSFSLGGYARETNPELAAAGVSYFGNVRSCGTNTATSVPCLFSNLGRAHYDEARAKGQENVLDVLVHAGFFVEWEDNNTGSKGVARRLPEERMGTAGPGSGCPAGGCTDEVLIEHLRLEIERKRGLDEVFVLHQIGSHGPAYYERYPDDFARFQPDCRSAALQSCTPEQIRNSYDNTILYTDHVLAGLVGLLREEGKHRPTALVYVSDHGESTGESGLYLHGAPYALAPDEQTRVPMIVWTSPAFEAWRGLDPACVQARRDREISHDHVFHTLLGLLDVRTSAYTPALDALAGCAPTA